MSRHLASNPSQAPASLKSLKRLVPFLWPKNMLDLKIRVVLAVSCLIGSKIANVYIPIYFKKAVDALSFTQGQAMVALPLGILLAYGLVRVMSSMLSEARDLIFAKVEQRAIRAISLESFQHLHQLSLRFHLDRHMGGLSRAIERGRSSIETLLRFVSFNILPTLFEIVLVCVALYFMYDLRFSIVTFVTLLSYVIYTLSITEWRTHYVRSMNQADTVANSKAIDSLLNYETVKYFGNEEFEERRFDLSLKNYEGSAIRSKMGLAYLNMGQGLIIALGLTVIMYMGAAGIVDGTMTVGDFVLVNTYLLQLYAPLNILGFAYRESKQALVNIEEMMNLLEVPQEVKDSQDARDLEIEKGCISFENVTFSYNPDRQILKGVSFKVPAGKTVAIVGATGSGKSTIARLLFRFYDVGSGSISIDGQDIRSLTQKSLRQAIGVVPQDTVLFNDTIYYNIAYGNPLASREEVFEASRLAHLHEFITKNLPQDYDTLVGERGLKLSGGEKQRVAIARTILKKPSIFLFDEATSSLDTNTEKSIQQNLAEVSKKHTTLVIAHRLSTVVDSYSIIVLDQGQIVEQGNHKELMALNGKYAQLWAQQQKEEKEKSASQGVEQSDLK